MNTAKGSSDTATLYSWNTFKDTFNQSMIEETADLLVSTGLRDAGYTILTLDDGWQATERAADGRQQANLTKLPGGIKGIADYLHARDLQLGIYSDAGIHDCGFAPGSWGYEELDAATYAGWEVDYLKYDNCGGFAANVESPQVRFGIMRDALRNSGREIFYSLCQWGHQFPWFWADQIGQSYRMSGDITATFSDTGKDCACKTAYCLNTGYAGCSVLTIIRKMREISAFQKPGSWADMDMLEIGNGNMTLHEQQTHQSFWAALKSPLIIGADLRALSNESLGVLKNPEIIAISQDSVGKAVTYLEALSKEKELQVWAGPLSGNRTVILAFNEANTTTTVNIPLDQIPNIGGEQAFSVRDVWAARDILKVQGNITAELKTHQTSVLILQLN
ncbi:Alpha-galactosidase alpha-n-acetylgalactosaminidase [Lasiodiplodia theobromae]|uniref:Alpha-galactosidase alpha-n-acetylgalactosaminidase n=1 Tax=Lasiodiplodia theobromae TaxID=45133 RepID=UPI0015C40380|nr:Alpha-galactosidase alpha-n-acetylgalactosaminidase [Lasiodiplodia theobromae]KAF4545898.1 Alpha-galactosidase alpha-n-acetylgalactosaminidase [Lasiodiplodia theobromae]